MISPQYSLIKTAPVADKGKKKGPSRGVGFNQTVYYSTSICNKHLFVYFIRLQSVDLHKFVMYWLCSCPTY